MPNHLPAAVVFDLDGTLIDTEELWDEVRRELAAADGVAWPEEATTAMMGLNTREWSTYLWEQVGVGATPEEAARRTIEGMAEHHRRGLVLLPGAIEAVAAMAARGPIAIASSSPVVLIRAAIEAMGVADLFGAVVSTEEVPRGKPFPDGYLEACRRLGVDPTQCVAVEDTAGGIRSAHAAGLKVVTVPREFEPPTGDVLSMADAVLDSLVAFTPEFVASLFAGDQA